LVSLLRPNGEFLSLGIVTCFDAEKRIIRILMNEKPIENMIIQWGYIKIDPETFEELTWIKPWSL